MRNGNRHKESHCTICAVGLEMADNAVGFPLADVVFLGQYGHDIGHFISRLSHLLVFPIKFNKTAVISPKTKRNKPF